MEAGLIYFNNTEVKPTVDYYVQKMYGQNAGSEYLPSTLTVDNRRHDVRSRVGVSVVKDGESGDLVVKLVNLLPVAVKADVEIPSLAGRQARGSGQSFRAVRPIRMPYRWKAPWR